MEGWIRHTGYECPVSPRDFVEVYFDLEGPRGEAASVMNSAGMLAWGMGEGPDGEGRIYWYRRLVPEHAAAAAPATAASTPAGQLLSAALQTLEERAKDYDQPGGERNMASTVIAFNAITGRDLKESEGWLFMELLKARRDFCKPDGHEDSQLDRINYAALGAEARRAGR